MKVRGIIIFIAAILAISGSLVFSTPNTSAAATSKATVKETTYNAKGTIISASGLNVRKSASDSAARIGGVYKNNVVTIVAKAGSFYKIKFGNGYGYISNDSRYIKVQATAANSTVKETAYNAKGTIISASGLNVRKSASTSAARIGGVYKNNVVTIVAKAGSFYKIKFGNGYGYISNDSRYIKVQATTANSAVKETTYNAKGTIISASGLNVRKSASASAARIGGVYKNNVVTIIAKAGSFYKIKFGNGYGYISNDSRYIKVQATPTNTTVKETTYNAKGTIISASGLNVRKSASASATRIGGVYKNNVVTIVAKAGSFYKIKFGNGYGYISNDSRYIKVQATPANTVKETAYNAKGTIISASGLNVRKSASASAARIGGVYKNNVVTIVAKAGNFYKIKFGSGYGYISNDSRYIKIQTTTSNSTVKEIAYNAKGTIISASGLNVLKAPSTIAARIGSLKKNNVVTIVAKAGNFYKIWYGNGYGYISNDSRYIKIQATSSKPPTTEMEIFREALAFTKMLEGGYVNHPSDPGGATNKGITQNTYNKYRNQIKKPRQSVKYISNAEVEAIYYQYYWKPVKADRMNRSLAIVMFDTAVNLGVHGNSKAGGAIKHLQKAMNIKADGSWGSTTEKAFSKIPKNKHYSYAVRVVEYNKAFRYERVKQDSSQKVFLEGWLNRDNQLLNYIKKIGY